MTVHAAIRRLLDNSDADRAFSQSLFATTDPAVISGRIERIINERLSATVSDVLHLELSVGAAVGLRLSTGARVFMKLILDRPIDELRATWRVLSFLSSHGFPCPATLAEPFRDENLVVGLFEYRAEGELRNTSEPRSRRTMARYLAQLHSLGDRFVAENGEPSIQVHLQPRDQLWPTPHNALFDFSKNAGESSWVDEIASAAREIILEYDRLDQRTVSHVDWSSKHFRFDTDDTVTVIYDWDSLRMVGELASLGMAAATHLYNWYIEIPTMVPTQEQAMAFTADYAQERGIELGDAQSRHVSANACFTLCYITKCKYSDDVGRADASDEARMLRTMRNGVYF